MIIDESSIKSGKSEPIHDVIIIGSGVTGLSCYYWLKKLGVKSVQVISPDASCAQTEQCPASATVGYADNFTRLYHAWGADVATLLWRYTHQCFEELRQFLTEKDIAFSCSDRIRLAYNNHEAQELETAILLLNKCGFEVERAETKIALIDGGSAILQIEEKGALSFDKKKFLLKIKHSANQSAIDDSVQKIEATHQGVKIHTAKGKGYSTQFLVVASAEAARTLLERGPEIFVPYVDQFSRFAGFGTSVFPVGTVISSFHGLLFGGVTADSCWFGGARYLRKNAGIGEAEPSIHEKSTAMVEERAQKIFGAGLPAPKAEVQAMLGCRPCDELPVIGPFGGNGRIMVATGYMGWGLALGFGAGKHVAELITNGTAPCLPRELSPERFRSF